MILYISSDEIITFLIIALVIIRLICRFVTTLIVNYVMLIINTLQLCTRDE